ncbi:putative diguanylate cyclase YegE [Pseudoruegeria aquimaris]|uniref:Putative diguanylate cyclase YegE n=1 Tax=Pseudoruegeria aquimaris TaxID=393663 RepID=A0A1Y5T789_9RHOB|nr:GGDEF domain-containing protein [Pseudoruegeria aquimaris]SLN56991.1 putative diguanylate cyclase YegE [Pseudoruegeria aquimaris]
MAAFSPANIPPEGLNRLMPMHVMCDAEGLIQHIGPTLHCLWPFGAPLGRPLFDVLEVNRPRGIADFPELLARAGERLHLSVIGEEAPKMKGLAVPLLDGGALLNLSFGIYVGEAVRRFDLTDADFAPTDLTMEMLYLIEAKSAAAAELNRLASRLQGARIAAEEQAFTDTLTGLRNRRAMDVVLNRLISGGQRFGLMHLDLDYFKDVNDTLGHAAGDLVLQHVARVLVEATREEDLAARVGGDEFVLLFSGLTDIDQLNAIASRIIERLEEPVMFEGKPCRISGSIGTTISDFYTEPEAEVMLHDADIALYASKHKGKACFTVFSKDLGQLEPPKGREKAPSSPAH